MTQPATEQLRLILMVDDNPDDSEATARALKRANLHNPFFWVSSGDEALEYLYRQGKYANDPAVERPALVLLDINMPGLDGKKTLRKIKEDKSLGTIPVVILTSSSDERDIDGCYGLGANTYITKPVTFEGLIKVVQALNDYWFQIALLPKA